MLQVKTKQIRQQAIIVELMKGMQPYIRSYIQSKNLILDILPLLLVVITPDLRPINLHLFTKLEKECLDHVVDVMIDYNLNYIQERTVEGTYEYKLG